MLAAPCIRLDGGYMDSKITEQIESDACAKLIEEKAELESEIEEYSQVVQTLRKEKRALLCDNRYLEARVRLWQVFCVIFLLIAVIVGCFAFAKLPAPEAEAVELPVDEKKFDFAVMDTEPHLKLDPLPEPQPSIAQYDLELEMLEAQEDYENEKIEDALLAKSHKIANCLVTFYCTEQYSHICGTGDGLTALGNKVTPGVSCAVPPEIPLGSTIMIDWGDGELEYRVADDRGGWVKGEHIDLAVSTHKEALEQGVKFATVYWVEE